MKRPGSLIKGSLRMPRDNDSPWLLDPHKRGLQNLDRMRRYGPGEHVDLVVVGAGAGGVTLAQRLARAGWRVVILEKGPFWDPDRDWVSDEKGAAPIYWTDKRIIGGSDPIEMGKNNSGVGVGGSMTHFAGYVPAVSSVRLRGALPRRSRRRLADLLQAAESLLRTGGARAAGGGSGLAVGRSRTRIRTPPHPIAGAASKAWRGAREYGIEMRVGPVSIVNGTFGNRPHCIYRGFCLQGCKVNAKASPADHAPARRDRTRRRRCGPRRWWSASRSTSPPGGPTGVTYFQNGTEQFEPADAVAVCGYAIETPRLLLHSTSKRFPAGIGNADDQVGRYVMVQGATQVAARFPEDLRMYKAPPPEVSSEQFYETDEVSRVRPRILDPDPGAASDRMG